MTTMRSYVVRQLLQTSFASIVGDSRASCLLKYGHVLYNRFQNGSWRRRRWFCSHYSLSHWVDDTVQSVGCSLWIDESVVRVVRMLKWRGRPARGRRLRVTCWTSRNYCDWLNSDSAACRPLDPGLSAVSGRDNMCNNRNAELDQSSCADIFSCILSAGLSM